MIGAMNNGVNGLLAFEKAIGVESNNVSNTTTIGHKEDNVTFQDLIYNKGYGKGVEIQKIDKNFEQGALQQTNVNLDVAISGTGMFIVTERTSGDVFYTRAGNFQQGEDGFLETQETFKVLGLSPQTQNIVGTDVADTMFTNDFSQEIVSIDVNNTQRDVIGLDEDNNEIYSITKQELYNINVKTTDYNTLATDDTVSGSNYKTASSKINDVVLLKNDYIDKLKLLQTDFSADSIPSTTQISQIDYSSQLSQLQDQNDYLQVTIDGNEFRQYFDTDLETTLNKFSDKLSNSEGFSSSIDSTSGILTIEGLVPGSEFNIHEANINTEYIPVSTLQEAVLGSGIEMVNSSRDALKATVENAGAKYLEITNVLDYTVDNNVVPNDEINLRLNALGLVENEKGSIEISDDGFVYVWSDNNKFLVSKISTAHFKNMQGLTPQGSNIFQQSQDSGIPLNADNLNTVIPMFVENGNSSFASTLSKLVFYQRAYEANAKSITVSDEFLDTAIKMKQ